MARPMVQIPAPQLVDQVSQAHQSSKAGRFTFDLVYSSPKTLFLCKSFTMVLGPYLSLMLLLGTFCRPPAGTMVAETALWGDIFSVSGK